MKAREYFILFAIILIVAIILVGQQFPQVWWSFILIGPILLIGFSDIIQKKHTINNNYPVLGHFRYMLESIRPEIMQYFVETDTEGRPINRIFRSLIYQRSKKANDTTPFGTQIDVYRTGYEWMNHSMYAKHADLSLEHPRTIIGGPDCKKPYSASLLNVSAMSFGSLSKNAIMALNRGAKLSNMYHNTGEGAISPYHQSEGGDLTWQIGTGYFGCRANDGNFDAEKFAEKAISNQVKMIEIKISQGAKPGHGGILPAAKNTPEIAKIRGVQPHTDVHSPPAHAAFDSPTGLMNFIKKLRDISGGKPVGFKLCIGRTSEFTELCDAMIATGIKPDFITIDGGEGGTGAAPIEFSNSLGMPLRDGLVFAHDTLVGYDLKKDIKIIASGKILTGFHMIRAFALGADLCNSARAMMMSIGCIQALQCNNNSCPVGVATQNKSLMKGLNVADKAQRVSNFHHSTINSFLELVAAAGLSHPNEIKREHINRRINMNTVKHYEELYPLVKAGSLLKDKVLA